MTILLQTFFLVSILLLLVACYCITYTLLQKNSVQVGDLINMICDNCTSESPELTQTTLNCSVSGRLMYFTTDIVFSNSDGTITASTLISILLSWLLAAEDPTITVAGQSLPLSKMCPTPVDSITVKACEDLFITDLLTNIEITSLPPNLRYIDGSIAFGFFLAGSLSGIVSAVAITLLLIL